MTSFAAPDHHQRPVEPLRRAGEELGHCGVAEVVVDPGWERQAEPVARGAQHGKVLAVGGFHNGSVKVWDATSGKEIRKLGTPHRMACSVAISPDGRTLAAGVGPKVQLWDLAAGRSQREINSDLSHTVIRLAFSPDGTWAATTAL